ncbi:E3 ubiquitin-protein ligase tom1 [Elasticomyces elasticus]|nr:E3 ubiquitin-protein ligase tom1 [Elasticomyces elasticus]KAK4974174.1 E3 ubiquitin-protein ligase tom1 [Elasticomyces elasticus]
MGKIKKVATERHTATLSPFVEEFVKEAVATPLAALPRKLSEFPQQWPFPRGDLYHWIPLLDRFDDLLDRFNKEYGLDEGPQTQPFARRLLEEKDGGNTNGATPQELYELGFSEEGDRELIECVVHFTRILHEHCGNRSLYASSGHMNDLLNTTSLSLVRLSLKLALRLAQRYQVAQYKTGTRGSPHAQAVLMMSHYNFTIDNLHKLAMPFPKPASSTTISAFATPGKGKEKASQAQAFNPSDLVTLAKEPQTLASKGDVGAVNMIYYDKAPAEPKAAPALQPSEASPVTPTPARRTSNLGPSRDRVSAGDQSESTSDLSLAPTKSSEGDTPASSAPKTFSITSTKVSETPAWALVREALPNVPTELRYELLNRIRIAKAFTSPDMPIQQLLETRLLAVANLSYSVGESKFQEKIGTPDQEEPRRYHLAQQLCDLLQPATNGQVALSIELETTVLQTLEGLLKSRHKVGEVIEGLSVSVNHGVLYYELRKVIATLHAEEHTDASHELRELEWRDATFDLIHNIQIQHSQSRVGEKMVAAGIMSIMVEVLSLRTSRAERFHERVLGFFASFIHNLQNAMQTFATDKGFDILADLTQYEIETAVQQTKNGTGLPANLKSKVVDYNISFSQQAILRQIFKFVCQMFENSGGTHDRLLRNLVDTPQMLASLKTVILDWQTFGSNVWNSAVNIMSAFIHNEPTSYQVVGEAGLPRAMLQTVVGEDLPEEISPDFTLSEVDLPGDIEFVNGEPQWPEVKGILPVDQTMLDIPTAFGAICLNENGMHLFQASKVLIKYFDIFVSPPHVKALLEDESPNNNAAHNIGSAFDELSRHQPRLKDQINMVVTSMVKRVAALSRKLAEHKANGAKLWKKSATNQTGTEATYEVDGGLVALSGESAQRFKDALENGTLITSNAETTRVGAEDIPHSTDETADALRFITACSRFLEGYFHNAGMCALFCEKGGAESVIDLVTSPSNPVALPTFGVYKTLVSVLKLMCEQKAHLVLPSLLRRLQVVLLGVRPITDDTPRHNGLFSAFGDLTQQVDDRFLPGLDGTTVLKSLSNVQALADVIGKILAPPSYSSRHSSQTNPLFTNLNFTEVYAQLVDDLSKLRAHCYWEDLALLQTCSPEFKEKTDPQLHQARRVGPLGNVELASDRTLFEVTGRPDSIQRPTGTPNGDEFAIKNVKVLRYALHTTPVAVTKFIHNLAQALMPRRTNEQAAKQHAAVVADHIAKSSLWELDFRKYGNLDDSAELKYVAMLLQPVTSSMLKVSFDVGGTPKEGLVLVLNKFYQNGGFTKLNEYLQRFGEVVASVKPTDTDSRAKAASYGLSTILEFYAQVVRQKTIVDASQSPAIAVRDHRSPDYFMPGQFVVEVRHTVLPAVSKLWYSPAIETMGDACVKKIIETMRMILKSDGEDRALKRSDNARRRIQTPKPEFALKNSAGVAEVQSETIDNRLAREAIYRCNGATGSAREYASLRVPPQAYARFPIPEGERSTTEPAPSEPEPPSSSQRSVDMADADEEDDEDDEMPELGGPVSSVTAPAVLRGSEDEAPQILDGMPAGLSDEDLMAMVGGGRLRRGPANEETSSAPFDEDKGPLFVTIEDLEEKRSAFRDALIDRCLEVLSAVPGVTFELSDLIQAAVAKSGESANPRADIGSTLVSSLMSLQGEDLSKEAGVKIAAYAHLVALILQDRDFFDSTLDELREYLDALVGWVQLAPEQKAEDAPWMEMVLLIIERMLAEDEQPVELKWDPPPANEPTKALSEPTLPVPVVSTEMRTTLFDALIDVLPKIGKNTSLALSVSRVLVMLTRRRDFAMRLAEKQSMHRLFLMIRQLAGSVNEKLHSSFMLILRHLVEDEAILRQIMQTDIRATFEGPRSSRGLDTSTYTRNLYHLVLRDPKLFVDVTHEMVEIGRFDGNPNRAQALALKKEKPAEASVEPPANATEQADAAQPSVETVNGLEEKPAETKVPVAESPDGVVSFLLRELSNYKDVEDRSGVAAKESQPVAQANGSTTTDVEMTDASAPKINGTPVIEADVVKPAEKPVFKAEDHSIYIYRCFILQCLSELLLSYSRTKVEFINFSRKPETQPATPAKARAGTLNYLLNVLIPVGTLEHKEDIAYRKKLSTSNWATSVVVSLCSRTPERSFRTPRGLEPLPESDSDLTFVRKFVLEHSLRCFKEATVSSEPLDVRYSRLLALGELFNRMLNKADRDGALADPNHKQQIGRFMYEKGYIAALTSAIAELDLNFPNAKRAVKYILSPLRQLTDLGVELSQTSDLSSSSAQGTSADEDDMSSATSVSEDEEDEREQTPDLLRNTALGVLESGGHHDEESSEDDDDEDDEGMEYDEYEEMDYEEEVIAEHGDVVSDDEEGAGGMGSIEGMPGDVDMDVEIVMNADGDVEDMDEDDDDDDDDDDEDGDDDEFPDHIDEITGDDENASMGEGDEGEWEEEDEGEFDADGEDGSPHGGPLDHIARVIAGDERSETGEDQDQGHLVRLNMGDGPEDYFDDELPPEDEEEEEEIDYENDVAYEPEIEGWWNDLRQLLTRVPQVNPRVEEDDEQDMGWNFDAPAPPPGLIRAPHNHHHHGQLRGFGGMFDMLGGGDAFRPTGIRSHRASSGARGEDEGVNPLLQREGSSPNSRDLSADDRALGRIGFTGRARGTYPPVNFIQDLVASVGARGTGTINVNLDDIPGLRARMPGMFPTLANGGIQIGLERQGGWAQQVVEAYPMSGERGMIDTGRTGGREEAQAVEFQVTSTVARWQEEARLLFGGKHHEKATRVNSNLLRLFVPPAMQAKLEHDQAEHKRVEAEAKVREEERKKAEAEKVEREAQEKNEREEQEARDREEAALREQETHETEANNAGEADPSGGSEMEGVEQSQAPSQSEEAPTSEAEPQPPAPRVMTTIRGREVDITSLGIDRDFLDAIPEDMREEVIMAQLTEQRHQAVQAGEQPSEISREFLEALPREIQQELLRQEATERRRRERQDTQRRATQEGNAPPAQPEEMNNADFMAMLDPGLRQAILIDADEHTLAALPEEVQAEARALLGDRPPPRAGGAGIIRRDGGLARVVEAGGHRRAPVALEPPRQRRPTMQMLDMSGVATLLRLMFVSLHHKAKSNLHSILSDVCKNTRNRADVISVLLSILQDGTLDIGAVERSFAQLTVKAKQASGPKTPQPLKRTPTGLAATPTTELSPLNIVQHCLSTLRALAEDNTKVPSFFLNEHETTFNQKGKTPKKGKARESKAARYPLNALLALLDRKIITDNVGVMEILAALLTRVTQPLTILLRRAKDAQDAAQPKVDVASTAPQPEAAVTGDVPMAEIPTGEALAAPAAGSTQQTPDVDQIAEDSAARSAAKAAEKKMRELTPPEVPEENVRLVVNILAARECPSKTFTDTLDIIKNLSAIPGTKEVFGRELVRQAQELGQVVLADLEELTHRINSAETSTDLQGLALASFSSTGSKQRMLARVILALDHLFDPKRTPVAQSSDDSADPTMKDNVLAQLYESGTFEKLWGNLSACLAAIRARGNLVNVANILLPLIESLMVVCRNSTPKEAPQTAAIASPTDTAPSTPSPDSHMEGLFFRFTEDNRKILNELIRNNPKLMSGQFSILAKNSKVLEFDNKRTYFSRKLHNRGEVRVAHPSLQLNIRRDQVFLDSFKSLYYKSGDEIKYGKLNIRFHGEEGVDAGGVSREWFAAMARQMFNPDYALFVPVASDRTTFHPNELSDVNSEHLLFFKFIGRIIGKALYENRVLDCHFSRAVYRRILGKSVSLKDMESLDLDYYKSLVWLLENDITDVAFQTFSIDVDRFGASQTVDLIDNGRDIPVTEENKHDYVQRIVEYRLIVAVNDQLEKFLDGFHEIIPKELVAIFNEQELELLISGLPDIDVDDWKNTTEYHNYQATSPQIQWFWRAVRSFDKEEKAKLLQFVTGTSKVPLNGFKELEGMNGFAKFNIHRDYSSKEKLPSSHTCFNQLDLPEYDTYEHLRQQLYTAITAGSEYFGFA